MASDKNLKPISFDHKTGYQADANEYTFWLVHRKHNWWKWLLLGLLLLFIASLFVKCEREVTVTCVDAENGALLSGTEVTMSYTSHFLMKDWHFFINEPVTRTEIADENGQAVFKKLPCSIYSYIFYCLSHATYEAVNECHEAEDEVRNFHYVKNVELKLLPLREDLRVLILDKETEDPIPGARLIYRYIENGEDVEDEAQADPAGVAVIPAMRVCSSVEELRGSSYGYEDDTLYNVPCQDLLIPNEEQALRLTPIKERFDFFVKNDITKQPIPAAECLVTLTWPGESHHQESQVVLTSIDGKGTAFYEDAFVLSTIHILAHKVHYRDSTLQGGPWTVERFVVQDEDTRTVWLRPEPYQQEFVTVDSLTSRPVAGATNRIRIIHPDGTEELITETSNRNGVFPVTAMEDDRVEIVSEKDPGYKDKDTTIPKFGEMDDEDKIIRMEPDLVTLVFRTVNADAPQQLVPGCTLVCTGSLSGQIPPTNSGSGEFKVSFRRDEQLTIRASKKQYVPTTDKVNAKTWDYLKVDQERRDIPLRLDLPPCSGGKIVPKTGNYHEASYNMGMQEGDASISGDFYGYPDWLTVYNGPDKSYPIMRDSSGQPISHREIPNGFAIPFHFTTGAVTVVVETSTHLGTSNWEYVVNCPNR